MLDTGYSMLDTGYSMLVARCWALGAWKIQGPIFQYKQGDCKQENEKISPRHRVMGGKIQNQKQKSPYLSQSHREDREENLIGFKIRTPSSFSVTLASARERA
jgi:hypothetical protein